MEGPIRREPVEQSEAVSAGLKAGILAGLAMAMVSMMMAMMTGEGFWAPVKKISVTLLGQSAVQHAGFEVMPVMVGMIIHFGTAIGFGILFVMLMGRQSYGSAIGCGIAYGLGIWVVMHFLVLPVINSVMAQMPYLQFAMLHIIFGGMLGSYPAFLPPVSKSEPRRIRPPQTA